MKTNTLTFILAFISLTVFGQTFVMNETFDADTIPLLPVGWETTTIADLGFRTEDGNNSDNPGASGLNNVVIRNTDSSGTYVLTSPVISTAGLSGIRLLFSSRVSNNFLTSGSTLPMLECSTDGGQSWEALTYTDNDANSTWSVVNDSLPIVLPPSADDNPNVMLRWTVNIVNDPSGTYRLDDVKVFGGTLPTLVKDDAGSGWALYPNPCDQQAIISATEKIGCLSLTDAAGRVLMREDISDTRYVINIQGLQPGMYLVIRAEQGKMVRQNLMVR